jgi:hypothetical protein
VVVSEGLRNDKIGKPQNELSILEICLIGSFLRYLSGKKIKPYYLVKQEIIT